MTLQRYAMCVIMYAGDKFPSARFIFEAKDDKEAEDKAYRWARYQGMVHKIDVISRPAHANETMMELHNDYLR